MRQPKSPGSNSPETATVFHKKEDRLVVSLLNVIAYSEYIEGQQFLTRREVQHRWEVADKIALAALQALKDRGILEHKGRKTVVLSTGAITAARTTLRSSPAILPLPETASRATPTQARTPGDLRYRRLASSLLNEIASGAWPSEKKFLSRRAIEQIWQVSRKTADSANALLVAHGILRSSANGRLVVTPNATENACLLLDRWRHTELEPREHLKLKRNRLLLQVPKGRRRFRLAVIHNSKLLVNPNQQWTANPSEADLIKGQPHPFRHLAGFFYTAVANNCTVEFHCFDGEMNTVHRLTDLLSGKQLGGSGPVDGVAIMPLMHQPNLERLITALQKNGLSTICAMNKYEGLADAVVECNETKAGFIAAKTLLDSGHRRILLIDKRVQHERFLKRRRMGILSCIENSGLRKHVTLLNRKVASASTTDAASILSCIRGHRSPPPTAILFVDIKPLYCIEQTLWNAGVRFPKTVSAIVCGPRVTQSVYYGLIDTVDRDRFQLGQTTAAHLIQMLNGITVPRSTQIDTPYLKRGTVRMLAG